MSSGPAPSQWGIDTGAKSWDGTGLAWLGLLQRTVTSRSPELASRSTVYLAEQDKREEVPDSSLLSTIVKKAGNLGEEQSLRSKFLVLLMN